MAVTTHTQDMDVDLDVRVEVDVVIAACFQAYTASAAHTSHMDQCSVYESSVPICSRCINDPFHYISERSGVDKCIL